MEEKEISFRNIIKTQLYVELGNEITQACKISHPHMGVKAFKKVFHKSIFYTLNEFLRRKVQIPRHFFCKPLYKSQFRALDKRSI